MRIRLKRFKSKARKQSDIPPAPWREFIDINLK